MQQVTTPVLLATSLTTIWSLGLVQQSCTTALQIPFCKSCPGCCLVDMLMLYLVQVLTTTASFVEIQPWVAMWQQQRLPLMRLLLQALEKVHRTSGTAMPV